MEKWFVEIRGQLRTAATALPQPRCIAGRRGRGYSPDPAWLRATCPAHVDQILRIHIIENLFFSQISQLYS